MRPRHAPVAEGVIDLAAPPMTAVYRAYDARGELLYIGVTDGLEHRLTQHRVSSPWYGQAATVEWEAYASRKFALELERDLIRSLEPPHNTVHKVHRDYRPVTMAELHAMARKVSPVANL